MSRNQAYCNLYAFLAQIVAFADSDLEKLCLYGKMLLRKLPGHDAGAPIVFGHDVVLHQYRLDKKGGRRALLGRRAAGRALRPRRHGDTPGKDEKEKLSRLIDLVNERFATSFDAQGIVDGVTRQLMDSEELQRAAKANPRANFDLVGAPAFDETLVDRHAKHAELIDRVFADEELLRFIRTRVLDDIYARLNETSSAP